MKWILVIFLLIGIILLMLNYTPRRRTVELFENNNIVGGAIVTLQNDFTKLLVDFETLEKNIEKSYSVPDLSGNSTTISKLYTNIQNIKYLMNAVNETNILQPIPQKSNHKDAPIITPTVSNIISNTHIKNDIRWSEFQKVLTDLKDKFTEILKNINEYLATISDPLPAYITDEVTEIIKILKNMRYTIITIIRYIGAI